MAVGWPFRDEDPAYALIHRLPRETNPAFSPLSATLALRMLRPGVHGETARQLARLLPPDDPQALATLLAEPTLLVANGVWAHPDAKLRPEYAATLARDYGAEARTVLGDPVPIVNQWASEQTEGRVRHVLEGADQDWRLILASAMHYRGEWQDPFMLHGTTNAAFAAPEGPRVVPTMRQTARMGVGEIARAPFVLKPLRDGFALFAALPPANQDPWKWLLALGSAGLRGVPDRTRQGEVILSLPRFRAGGRMDLAVPLRATTPLLFARGDFGAMSDSAKPLGVSGFVQAARFDLDENGVVASAVTGFSIATAGDHGPPVERTFDRPFAYALLHSATRTPLMVGACDDPAQD